MTDNFYELLLVFIIYSFLGWLLEVVVKSYSLKKLVNRGFLLGPICPIYGFGALLITYFLTKYKDNWIIVFVLGTVITSIVEYFTSYILEKIFHNRWWDYSDKKYNLNGRIRLDFSAAFGIFACLVIYSLNEAIMDSINMMNKDLIVILSISIIILLIADIIYSVIIAYNLRNRIIIAEELKHNKFMNLEIILKRKVANLKLYPTRLLNSFPNLKSKYEEIFNKMKKIKEKYDQKNKR